ncbi:MAG TPA: hypothetical protein EYP52_06800 [Anaerolineae bacterium]|nr:hypothetical protein [Anaerolineae bacterium]
MDKATREAFETYLNRRVADVQAVTPGQQLEVIRQLREEAYKEGRVPMPSGVIYRLPTGHPAVRAALEGKPVSMGSGKTASRRGGGSGRVEDMSKAAKFGILAAILLVPLLLVLGWIVLRRGGEAEETVPELPEREVSITLTPTSTRVQSTPVGTISSPTPTPYALSLGLDEAASGGNDPASVEFAGHSFVLGEGHVDGGVWSPSGAEWLAGTELRRVIAVPYGADLANAVSRMRSGEKVRLRLRSGEVVEYTVDEVRRIKRHEIEVLSERRPSIAIILFGERSGERWVIVGSAVQQPATFIEYTPVPTPVGVPHTPTPIPASVETLITSTRVITNESAGLVLEIGSCNRVLQVGEQQPPRSNWQFAVCDVTVAALRDYALYSGEAMAITERDWILDTVDWWPRPVAVSDAIGEGVLSAGGTVSGQIAGIVIKSSLTRRSEPVLVWEQAGIRYVILLEP